MMFLLYIQKKKNNNNNNKNLTYTITNMRMYLHATVKQYISVEQYYTDVITLKVTKKNIIMTTKRKKKIQVALYKLLAYGIWLYQWRH
jgi:hypothetical protein